MKFPSKFRSLASTIFALGSLAGWVNGALVVDITEGSTNNAIITLTGSGTITANGGSGDLINVVTTTDTFIVDGTPIGGTEDSSVTPTINLGAASTTRIFIGDLAGTAGYQSRIGFGQFTGDFVNGDDASDLNGSYVTSIPFSLFNPGTHTAILGFTTGSASLIDIGAITVNVGVAPPIPEPTSAVLFGLAAFGFSARRRR